MMFQRTKPKSFKTVEREKEAHQTFSDYLRINEVNVRSFKITTEGIRKVAAEYGCNPNTVRKQLRYFFNLIQREARENMNGY